MSLISILLVFWFVASVAQYMFWKKMEQMDQAYHNAKKLRNSKK